MRRLHASGANQLARSGTCLRYDARARSGRSTTPPRARPSTIGCLRRVDALRAPARRRARRPRRRRAAGRRDGPQVADRRSRRAGRAYADARARTGSSRACSPRSCGVVLPRSRSRAASTSRATVPVILAANHRSFLDSIFIPLVVRRRVTFVAKAEYFDDPKTAWFFRGVGQIPIRREGGSASERALDVGDRSAARRRRVRHLSRRHAHARRLPAPRPHRRRAARRCAPARRSCRSG